MSLKSSIQELKNIEAEIKRLSSRLKLLRRQKNKVENSVANQLNAKNQPGVKYNGSAILVQKKEKRVRKNKKEKNLDILNVLISHGITNPKQALKDVLEANSGHIQVVDKIKIKNLT